MNGRFGRILAAVTGRMPRREDFERSRWIAPIAHRVLSPELWRFTRRSVPRGVALGLFAGFIIPIGQIFLASFLALPARANVSIAVLVTFVTNPFTLPFWVVVANRVGRSILHASPTGGASAAGRWMSGGGSSGAGWDAFIWFAQSTGFVAIGFIVLSVVGAALGYVISGFAWRTWIGRKHRARRERHARARTACEAPVCEAVA